MDAREPTWDRPGPGTWLLDSSHSGPAPGPILRYLMATTLERGLAEGLAMFGAPLKGMEVRWVNGKFYRRLVPIVGANSDRPPPPAPVLWLASRVHPAFRKQERRAKESFALKRWRAELTRWENEWKPRLIARNLELSDVPVGSLDDAALADHLSEVHDHVMASGQLHHRLHVSDMGPLGNLMVALRSWGLATEKTFEALVAASPATRAPRLALRALAQELRDAGVDPEGIRDLDSVRAASSRARALLDDYLRHHGWRLTTGYDVEDLCLIELPDVVVTSLRAAAATGANESEAPDEHALAALERLRSDVAESDQAQFDELVEDARLSYGLRDENGPLTYEWPAGLLRRALLEAGTRLRANGVTAIDGDVFELHQDEVLEGLRTGIGPTPEEVGRRRSERRAWATMVAPERLGPEEGDPPFHLFPPNLARITDIVLTVVGAMEAKSAPPLSGTGVGTGTYRGRARVVSDVTEALMNLEPGDVLVAPYTAPTYNAVIAIAGGLVVEQGGLLCHAAVIARELGIPAVVGAREAMQRIPDGAMVEIDTKAGTVVLVAS